MSNLNEKIVGKLREFGLTSLSIDNGTTVFLLTAMIFLFGLQSYNSMPKEQFPEVSFPTVFVNTPYFGNSAVDIENLITRPLEKEINTIIGLESLTSVSVQDFSMVTVEFDPDIEMDEAVRKVKDAVDIAKNELPTDLESDPQVLEINLSEIPILSVNLSGDYSVDQLKEYAEYLEDEFENLPQVSEANIKGALEREVKIDVDLAKMESLKISFNDIENAVSSENLSMSGGEIQTQGYLRAVRIIGQFENVQQIQNIIVKSESQRPVYLKDIARVTFGYKDRTSIARSDGLPVVSVDVIKRTGENLIEAADNVKTILKDAENRIFPADLKVSIFNDQSYYTKLLISNLENSIISGIILVILVLLFFMGLRNASFVGIAIPLSMLAGVLWLFLTDVTLNMVVLFSLILALGMLVDNGIVIVENVYRYFQRGYSPIEAAKYGAGEVALPIIASTATTLAAFLPIAFWPGLFGEFMKYLPITLILVLISSLLVALIINPVFTSRFMKIDVRSDNPRRRQRNKRNTLLFALGCIVVGIICHFVDAFWARNLLAIVAMITLLNYFVLRPGSFYFQDRVMPALESGYNWFITRVLRRRMPIMVLAGTFGLLVISIMALAINMPKVIFFPSADPLYINVFVELPLGRDIQSTDRVVKVIEGQIDEVLEPYHNIVESVLTQIGENTSDPNSPPEPGSSPHKARITVTFVPTEERGGVSTAVVMDKIRSQLDDLPGVQIVVDQNASGPPAGKPINIELQGPHMDELALLSEDMINFINNQNIGGIEELKTDVQIGKPELLVHIDRESARRFELSTGMIASAIRTSIYGKEVSKYKVGEDEYPIQLRLDTTYRNNASSILNQRITFRDPASGLLTQVPISAVADIEYSSTYSAIKRKDMERVITVHSNVLAGYNANEVVSEIRNALQEFNFPDDVNYEFTGEQQQQAEDMGFLETAFLISIFLIFLILVSQFNSIVSPFIIILSVLFSTIGVFLGYALTGRDISVIFTGVGIISLAGIVVNNAILLVDYTDLLIKRKAEETGKQSIWDLDRSEVKAMVIEGGATRLRPVLLTAITTILGLIPLAIGLNIDFFTLVSDLDPNIYIGGDNTAIWGPLAWTVIYGLIFSTFLTLIVVPTMYWLAYRLKAWIRSRRQPAPQSEKT